MEKDREIWNQGQGKQFFKTRHMFAVINGRFNRNNVTSNEDVKFAEISSYQSICGKVNKGRKYICKKVWPIPYKVNNFSFRLETSKENVSFTINSHSGFGGLCVDNGGQSLFAAQTKLQNGKFFFFCFPNMVRVVRPGCFLSYKYIYTYMLKQGSKLTPSCWI